jgi:hypothetical protein
LKAACALKSAGNDTFVDAKKVGATKKEHPAISKKIRNQAFFPST